MDQQPSGKLSEFGTTIFTVMSKMAADHGAINLAQGFPDFDGPKALMDRVSHHMAHGHNQYAPMVGVPELRQEIAGKVAALYGYEADPETDITITPGATEGIYCAITALVEPGDEVIVIDPCYDTYVPNVLLNGAVPRRIPMLKPGFRIDWQRISDAVSDRTRLLVLNSPHNPVGSCLDEGDISALREIVAGRRLFVVSDEVYEHICFDGRPHLSLLRYPDLAERSFVVSSFGKTYHVTGWRIGYAIAGASLMTRFRRIHQFINFSTNAPLSHAIADFMRDSPEFHLGLGRFYQQKRDLFCELLGGSRFSFSPAGGTYFQIADYSRISDVSDVEFARELTVRHGVAAIPVSVFYGDKPDQRIVRFCFAKEDDTLRQAARILCEL